MKKILKFLSSMPFAIALLIVFAVACALSSAVTQGQAYDYYAARYGERMAGLILALRLDDAFHSWWFIGLSAVLCLNLLCCNLIRLPVLLKKMRIYGNPENTRAERVTTEARGEGDPRSVFTLLRMPEPRRSGDGRFFSVRNRAGFMGAWVCHLGIFLLILGFALGQMTAENYIVYAMPGKTVPLDNTGLTVRIDDFRTEKTESGFTTQYTTDLTVNNPAEKTTGSGTASVNAPANLFGYKFFQNSTGWGAAVAVLKNGEELQADTLCPGEFIPVKDKQDLVIYLQEVYPDYVPGTGMNPLSVSDEPNNPAYLYRVFYQGQQLGMNILTKGEELTIDEYTVLFREPRRYTLLAVKRDSFIILVLLGGLVTLAGLVMAFWLQPRAVWAIKEESGWHVYGQCRKGGTLFRDEFRKAAEDAGFIPCESINTEGEEA